MGTNFYLHRQSTPCPTCGHDPTVESVHIGKSSIGWVFLWRGWRAGDPDGPGVDLTNPEEWADYLREQEAAGSVIRDEYRQDHTVAGLLARVMEKRLPRKDGSKPERNSNPRYGGKSVPAGADDIAFHEFF